MRKVLSYSFLAIIFICYALTFEIQGDCTQETFVDSLNISLSTSRSRFFWTGNIRRAVLPVGVTRPEADFDVSTNLTGNSKLPSLRGARRPEIFWTFHVVTSNFFDFYTFNEGHSGCPGPLACAPRTRVHPGACVQWPTAMPWQRASACVRACKRTARSTQSERPM